MRAMQIHFMPAQKMLPPGIPDSSSIATGFSLDTPPEPTIFHKTSNSNPHALFVSSLSVRPGVGPEKKCFLG
jgi:hypothetical protein